MSATLGLGGGFDLLEKASAPDPIISGIKDLFSNLGPNDFGSFSFNTQTVIDGEFSPTSSKIDLTRFTQFSGSFVFGGPQSIALGAANSDSDDGDDPVTFGGSGSSTILNFNLLQQFEVSVETIHDDPEILDIGSSMYSEPPEDDLDLLA
jgi:hypothetical protein